MGIDKSNAKFVYIDMPEFMEDYYQEIGRAGRDSKPAFYSVEEKNFHLQNISSIQDTD